MNSYVSPDWSAEPNQLLKVLHVVSSPRNAFWFFKSLHEQAEAQFSLTTISNIQQAAEPLAQQHFDAVFLHTHHTDSEKNLADITLIQQWTDHAAIVAIIHKAHVHQDHVQEAQQSEINTMLQAGIDDYILASDITTPLLPRLVSYVVERKQSNLRLAAVTGQDSITHLPNRDAFMRELQQQLSLPLSAASTTAVLMIDLDQFKNINDTHGHTLGDQLLRSVATRLKNAMRQSDVISRIGGDEFLILLRDMPNIETIKRIARNLLDTIAQAVNFDSKTLFTTASIGIATRATVKDDAEALLKHADIAMYCAKQQGGNRYTFFTRDQQVAASLRTSLESELHKAIEQKNFFLTYQPQINARTNELYGAEVLIRWNHPQHGTLTAGEFVPILESTGLIAPVTEWVIYTAVAQWQQLIEQNIIADHCDLSINLSPRFLSHPNFKSMLLQLDYLPANFKRHMHFEITENLFVDPEKSIDHLRYIKECGFQLAMDDFGTGYSSLSYLKHFPLDCIKLDCQFTRNIACNKVDAAITKAVVNLSHELDIALIAEGVEDAQTLKLLTQMGCDIIQGYYYSKPRGFDDFQAFCREKRL